jgi:hypothetical protein
MNFNIFLILEGAPYTPTLADNTTMRTSHADTICDIREVIRTDSVMPTLISATNPIIVEITGIKDRECENFVFTYASPAIN